MAASNPTIYDHIKFPEYRFREYPKMVYPPNGPVYAHPDDNQNADASHRGEAHLVGKPIGVVVHSPEEEEEVLASSAGELRDVMADLRARAEALGIAIDGRWGLTRLRDEIAKAEEA